MLSRYDNSFEKGRGRGKSAARVCKASSVNAQFSARARSREVFLPRRCFYMLGREEEEKCFRVTSYYWRRGRGGGQENWEGPTQGPTHPAWALFRD